MWKGVKLYICQILWIYQWRIQDFPFGGGALGGGGAPMSDAAKTYTKAKELGPVGGGRERIICEKKRNIWIGARSGKEIRGAVHTFLEIAYFFLSFPCLLESGLVQYFPWLFIYCKLFVLKTCFPWSIPFFCGSHSPYVKKEHLNQSMTLEERFYLKHFIFKCTDIFMCAKYWQSNFELEVQPSYGFYSDIMGYLSSWIWYSLEWTLMFYRFLAVTCVILTDVLRTQSSIPISFILGNTGIPTPRTIRLRHL